MGWTVLHERFTAALQRFADTASWLRVVRAQGVDGESSAYGQALGNAADSSPSPCALPWRGWRLSWSYRSWAATSCSNTTGQCS